MLELVLGKAGAIGAGILAVFGVLAAMFGFARRGGKIAERQAQQKREAKAVKVANQVDDDVARMTPEQRRKELGKWAKQ